MPVDTYDSDESTERQEKIEAQREADREASFEDEQEADEQTALLFEKLRRERQLAIEQEENTPKNEVRLFSYSAPLIVALLKDLLDFVGIGSLPAIGTVVTVCFTILIFFLFLFTPGITNGSRMSFLLRNAPLLVGETVVEGLFVGLNLLPITFGVILWIYFREKLRSAVPNPIARVTGAKKS